MQTRHDIRRIAVAALPWSAALQVAAAPALLGALVLATGTGTVDGIGEAFLRYLLIGVVAALISVPGIALGAAVAAATRSSPRRASVWIGFGAVVPLGVGLLLVSTLGETTLAVLVGAEVTLAVIGGLLSLILHRRQERAALN